MGKRLVAGTAALGVAAAVIAMALVAGGGGGSGPRALPVLGAGGGAAADEAASLSSPVGGGGGPGYGFTGDASGLAAEADAWSVAREDGEARARALAEVLGVGELTDAGEQWTAKGPGGILTVDRQPGLPWYYSATVAQVDPVPPDTAVSSDGSTAPSCVESERGSEGSCEAPSCDTGIEPAFCAEPGSTGGAAPGGEGTDANATCDPGPCPDDMAGQPVPADDPDTIDCAMPECPPGSMCTQACPELGPDGTVEPVPMPEPQRPADLPSAEEAEAIARDFLTAAGNDLDGARTRVDDAFSSWVLVADPVVGGLPTFGMTSAVGVGAGGVVEFANGWLADPAEGDTYDLIGVEAALDRLAATGGWFAYAPASPEDCPDCEAMPEPEPIELDSVEVGLQLVPAYGAEEAWLVPSYLFTIADGGPGAVIAAFAIADEHLVEPVPQEEEPVLVDPLEGEPMPVEPDGGIGDGAGPVITSMEQEPEVAPLPEGERAEVGVGYYLDVSTHCGVTTVRFDGRDWDAAPPLGDSNVPPGWAAPTEGGTMTLLAPDEAEFVGDAARTKVARFVPRPIEAGPPPGCE